MLQDYIFINRNAIMSARINSRKLRENIWSNENEMQIHPIREIRIPITRPIASDGRWLWPDRRILLNPAAPIGKNRFVATGNPRNPAGYSLDHAHRSAYLTTCRVHVSWRRNHDVCYVANEIPIYPLFLMFIYIYSRLDNFNRNDSY